MKDPLDTGIEDSNKLLEGMTTTMKKKAEEKKKETFQEAVARERETKSNLEYYFSLSEDERKRRLRDCVAAGAKRPMYCVRYGHDEL